MFYFCRTYHGPMSAESTAQTSNAAREARRAEILSTIPPWYRPAVHFAVPAVIGLGVMVAAILQIHELRPIQLLAVPLTILGGLGFEWQVHKLVLHHRLPLLETLYVRHELEHHVVFTADDFQMRSPRETRLVLMPAYGVVLSGLVDTPFVLLLRALVSSNVAFLFLATSMVFFLTYEWLHLAYHMPSGSWVGKLPLIAALREHHQRHHDPRLMKRWNFNVTIPLFDWIHGTVWSKDREEARAAQKKQRAAA